MKVDPKSFEKFPDLDVPNTRTAKPTVKDRLGENHAVISHEVLNFQLIEFSILIFMHQNAVG